MYMYHTTLPDKIARCRVLHPTDPPKSQPTLPHTLTDIDGQRERKKQQKHYITVCLHYIKERKNDNYNCTISLIICLMFELDLYNVDC